jgi:hypothetical protein
MIEGNDFGGSFALVPLGSRRFRVAQEQMELLFPQPKPGAAQELHIPPPVFDAPFSCRTWFAVCGGPWSERAILSRATIPSYSATDFNAYAGEYRSEELGATFTIVALSEGHLAVVRHGASPIPLAALGRDEFFASLSDHAGTLRFVRTSSGDVTGFTIVGRTPRHLSFTRVNVASAAGK